MRYIKIGKIVNTHALKGEVRIISDFEFKDQVFIIGKHLLVGRLYIEEIITSYRQHKNYDMVTFEGKTSINDVINYKGEPVYVLDSDLILNDTDILIEDLINFEVYFEDKSVGKITDYYNSNGNKLIYVGDKIFPYNNDFIVSVDKDSKIIYYKNIGGLL